MPVTPPHAVATAEATHCTAVTTPFTAVTSADSMSITTLMATPQARNSAPMRTPISGTSVSVIHETTVLRALSIWLISALCSVYAVETSRNAALSPGSAVS